MLVDVEIKHPFSNPDFTGFDVRGIVMFNGKPFISFIWSELFRSGFRRRRASQC